MTLSEKVKALSLRIASDIKLLRESKQDKATLATDIAPYVADGSALATALGVALGRVYTPEVFGAVGDGTTDDTVAVQAALDAAANASGVVLLGANYNIPNGGLTVSARLQIIGRGGFDGDINANSALLCSSTTADCLTINVDGCRLQDFAIINTATGTPTAGIGLRFTRNWWAHVVRVDCYGFWINKSFEAGCYFEVTGCTDLDPVKYGYFMSDVENQDFGEVQFHANTITLWKTTRNPDAAIRWESGGGVKFTGNKINGTGQPPPGNAAAGRFAVGIDFAIIDGLTTVDLLITGNSIENCSGAGVKIEQKGPLGTGNFGWITITGNEFYNSAYGIGIVGTNPGYLHDAVIEGNVFAWVQTPILGQNVDGLAIGLNRHRGCGNNIDHPVIHLGPGAVDVSVDRQNVQGDSIILFRDEEAENNTNSYTPSQTGSLAFTREIPNTVSTTDYTTLWRVRLGFYSAAFMELSIAGAITNVGTHSRVIRRLINREDVVPYFTVVGADVSAGFNYDLLLDTSFGDGWVDIKVRLNSVVGGAALHGRATLKLDGQVAQVVKGA